MPFADNAVRAELRKLARKGRLVDTAFRVFREAVFPGAPDDQIHALRIAFFAGAAELYAIMNAALDEGEAETDGDLKFMGHWTREITEFHERTLAAAAAPTKRPT